MEAIVHIIQAFPAALASKESGYGRVPLHIACHSNASLESIQILVSHRPSASIEQDNIGRVPLHYALSNGASYEIVKLLLNAATQVAGAQGAEMICAMADFGGWLPIHGTSISLKYDFFAGLGFFFLQTFLYEPTNAFHLSGSRLFYGSFSTGASRGGLCIS